MNVHRTKPQRGLAAPRLPRKRVYIRTWKLLGKTKLHERYYSNGAVHLWFNFSSGRCTASWAINTAKHETDKPSVIQGEKPLTMREYDNIFATCGQKRVGRYVRFDVNNYFITEMRKFKQSHVGAGA